MDSHMHADESAIMLPVHKIVSLFAPCASDLFVVPVKLRLPCHDVHFVSPYLVLGSTDACPFDLDFESKRPRLRFGPPLESSLDAASQGFQRTGSVHMGDALRMYADRARSAYLVDAAKRGFRDLEFACELVEACDAYFRSHVDSLCPHTKQDSSTDSSGGLDVDAQVAEGSVRNLKSLMSRLRNHGIPGMTSAVLFTDHIEAAFDRSTQMLALAKRRAWAARTVQRRYLHAYYCPEHPLCQKRLRREFSALSACMGQ